MSDKKLLVLRRGPWLTLFLALLIISMGAIRSGPTAVLASTFLPGQSLSLNGDGFVRVADHPALNPTDALTLEAWVWRDSNARCETVVGKNYTESYWLGFCNGPIRFYAAGSGTAVDGSTSIPARTWTHIAVTYDGVTRRYYVNGELDLQSTANNGPLTDNDSDLGIGFDPETSFVHNNFDGFIDEVRLWDRVRTQAEIQEDMRRELFGSDTGLVAYWRFNDSAEDWAWSGNSDDGVLEGNAGFTPRGVLPRHTSFGSSSAVVTVDGQCEASEYSLAGLERSGFATVHMQHDADDVYICFAGLEQLPDYAAHVLVDTDNSQSDPAGSGDYRFTIDIDGNTNAEEGNGSGGYTSFSPATGAWEAAHHVDPEFTWSAEFRLSRELLGIAPGWSQSLGMGFVEDRADNPDFSWPGALIETRPSTWGLVFVSAHERPGYTYNFDGYALDEGTGSGIAGSTIQLFASSAAGTFLLDTTTTDGNGSYTFSHESRIPTTFLVQQQDRTGYTSVSANVSGDGSAVTPNVIRYDSRDDDHTYATATFLDTRARPTPRAFNRHYLIVYSPPVNYSDLWPLIEMKRLQGFQVTAETVQNIESNTSGYDRAEKIRNWLRAQWLAHDPYPTYALLIGDTDVIPERQVGWEGDNAHRDPETSPAYVTDWYYADLDSDAWDADGDGYYGEFLYCAPWEFKVPVAGADLPGRCPPEGSPLREGAYGADSDTRDDWRAEISIGRIMLNDRVEVRRALETIARTEASGDLAKRDALLAGAMWYYYGNGWEDGAYKVGEGRQLRGAWPSDGNPPFGDDSAIQLETLVRPEIAPYFRDFFTLYEGLSPDDDPDLIPTAQTFNVPLLGSNLETALTSQDYGLVNVIGHGNELGVYHASWVRDYNDNERIENPVNPAQADGCTEACYEITGDRRFIGTSFVPAPASLPSVFFANACSTGDWIAGSNNIANRLLAEGKAAAWMGALSIVPVHAVDEFQRNFNRDIVANSVLLGDAAWGANGERHRTRWVYDWRMGTLQLFGDPAYSYWGNPADALAGWPQLGNDWWASGYSVDDGPVSGGRIWTADDHAPQSPPVVDREGYLLVGAEGRLVKFDPQGLQVDSAMLGVDVDYAPAVTTDGVYVVSGGTLYNYDKNLNLREQFSLGGLANGAPRVGPDGTIWVPTTLGMARINGSGLPDILSGLGAATSPAAFMTQGAVWAAGDKLYKLYISPDGFTIGIPETIPGVNLTPPAVGEDETILVGGDNGRLYAFTSSLGATLWTFDAGSAISGRPAVGPDGTAYIGTANGRVYAVRDGSAVWSRNLGTPISAALALDNNRLYVTAGSSLHALSLGSGATLWSVNLGGPTDGRSTPAIANHSIYVTRSDGVLVGITAAHLLLPPSGVFAQPVLDQPWNVQVSWQDNSEDETNFNVEICEITGTCATWTTTPANSTQVTLTQLPPSTLFYVRVQAVGNFGGVALNAATPGYSSEYGYSDPVIALPPAPGTPTGLIATALSSEKIALDWTYGGSDAELLGGFNVYRSEVSGGPYTLVGNTSPSTMTYEDTELTAGSTYYYRVAAVNDGGESSESNTANATTKALTLAAPTGLVAVQQTDNSIDLGWTDNATGETGYVVMQKFEGEGGFTVIATLPASATEYTVPYHLVSDGRIEYQVKAVSDTSESEPDTAVLEYAVLKEYNIFLPLTLRQ